jgi:hypothetical protein
MKTVESFSRHFTLKVEGISVFQNKHTFTLWMSGSSLSRAGIKFIDCNPALKWLPGRDLVLVVPEDALLVPGGPLLLVLMPFTGPGRPLVVMRTPCFSCVFLWVLGNPCGLEHPLLVPCTFTGSFVLVHTACKSLSSGITLLSCKNTGSFLCPWIWWPWSWIWSCR